MGWIKATLSQSPLSLSRIGTSVDLADLDHEVDRRRMVTCTVVLNFLPSSSFSFLSSLVEDASEGCSLFLCTFFSICEVSACK